MMNSVKSFEISFDSNNYLRILTVQLFYRELRKLGTRKSKCKINSKK